MWVRSPEGTLFNLDHYSRVYVQGRALYAADVVGVTNTLATFASHEQARSALRDIERSLLMSRHHDLRVIWGGEVTKDGPETVSG